MKMPVTRPAGTSAGVCRSAGGGGSRSRSVNLSWPSVWSNSRWHLTPASPISRWTSVAAGTSATAFTAGPRSSIALVALSTAAPDVGLLVVGQVHLAGRRLDAGDLLAAEFDGQLGRPLGVGRLLVGRQLGLDLRLGVVGNLPHLLEHGRAVGRVGLDHVTGRVAEVGLGRPEDAVDLVPLVLGQVELLEGVADDPEVGPSGVDGGSPGVLPATGRRAGRLRGRRAPSGSRARPGRSGGERPCGDPRASVRMNPNSAARNGRSGREYCRPRCRRSTPCRVDRPSPRAVGSRACFLDTGRCRRRARRPYAEIRTDGNARRGTGRLV